MLIPRLVCPSAKLAKRNLGVRLVSSTSAASKMALNRTLRISECAPLDGDTQWLVVVGWDADYIILCDRESCTFVSPNERDFNDAGG